MSDVSWPTAFDASGAYPSIFDGSFAGNVNLTDVLNTGSQELLSQVICYLYASSPDDRERVGLHVSSIFVILIVSSAVTFFPVLAVRQTVVKVPLYVYLFARYFGAGVIIATAFVHLLDPAYYEIGQNTCVGSKPGWIEYSWPPAIALVSSMMIFLMDFAAERYVEKKYGIKHGHGDKKQGGGDAAMAYFDKQGAHSHAHAHSHQHLHSSDQDGAPVDLISKAADIEEGPSSSIDEKEAEEMVERSFRQQIAAFLILEFGVIFHSVIIGLTLGTSVGSEFVTLYIVIIFHQSFEGLGIGARLSAIQFPKRLRWMPYALCAGYGLTTPISIAIGVGLMGVYNGNSVTANIIAGVLDSTSAGILMYTGFVELIARDFLFNPDRTDDDKQLTFMVCSLLLGAGTMSLLGKWA